jgi:hypothetical protein
LLFASAGHALHVTATAAGFFVSRTTDGVFDPAPAPAAYPSRNLWALAHRVSPRFRKAYASLLQHGAQVRRCVVSTL